MAQHDGKPYQPRRGPERPPQPAEDPAAPADGVDHLAMVAAEAEAMVAAAAAAAAAAEAEEEPMNPFEEEPEPGLEKDDLSDPGLEKDDLSEPGLEKDDLSEPGIEKDDLSEPEVDMEEDELEEEEEEEEEEEMEEEEDEAEGEGQHEHHGGNGEALPMDVEAAAAAAAAATAAGAPLDPHGTTGPATVHPTNQLTLSFQGEVYVFDSVSPDKVQAVLLLLGGRELNPGASPSTPYSKRLNYPHRVASLLRFREKRKERNFDKKIRYSVRKEVALRMQRKRGQFTSSKPRPDEATSELPTPDGSTNWASLEGRPPSAPECHHCGTNAKSTPMMRRGPDGPRTLCNACGLMWANKGMLRDIAKSSPSPRQVAVSAPNDSQNGNTV